MKKIAIFFLTLFFCLSLIYAVMQSPIGKNWTKSFLISSLEKFGIQTRIGSIEGVLPNQILLKEVSFEKEDTHVFIEKLQLRPILWRLLKKEIAFREIQAFHIQIKDQKPFDFQGKLRVNRRRLFVKGDIDGWVFVGRFSFQKEQLDLKIKRDQLLAKVKATLSPSLQSEINIQAAPLNANIHIHQEENRFLSKAVWSVKKTSAIGPLSGEAEGFYEDRVVKGSISSSAFDLAFDFKILPSFFLEGTTSLNIASLSSLGMIDTYGEASIDTKWSKQGKVQEIKLKALFQDLFYQNAFAEKLSLQASIENPFTSPQISYELEATSLNYNYLQAESLTARGSFQDQILDYEVSALGTVDRPFEIALKGSFEPSRIDLQAFSGSILNHPFLLTSPVSISFTENSLQIPRTLLQVADGFMDVEIQKTEKKSKAHLVFNEVPLDFLTLTPVETPLLGNLNLQADLFEKNGGLQGFLKGGLKGPFSHGEFEATLHQNELNLSVDLQQQEKTLLSIEGSLPIHLSLWPFDLSLKRSQKAEIKTNFDLRVEEILDYFNLKYHRLQGNLKGSLQLTNSLEHPSLEGKLSFTDGSYDNFYSGTDLQNIEAEILAKKNSLFLTSLEATDRQGKGSLQGKGEVKLLLLEKLPFKVDLQMEQLQVAEIDLVNVAVNGNVRIKGNTSSALAEGEVEVQKCVLTIPDHIPKPLPELQVVYRHAPDKQISYQKPKKPYPLELNLKLKAPGNIVIEGRGLESKWKGDFEVKGNYNSIAAKGNLDLVDGSFHFSSRSFKLSEGSLIFSGIQEQMPLLNLAAQTEIKGVTLTARLKGPLDNPQLTLLSNPPLSPASIMSFLLFGQDISEIGGFEALQIATSLAALSGTGPDLMESTRKSLGVDRLRVITEPDSEDGETVSLQVGKYIAKGVLVSLTQGTEESSTNISVEIEIKGHFVLQIESDQRQEQGKFTLKWSLNY